MVVDLRVGGFLHYTLYPCALTLWSERHHFIHHQCVIDDTRFYFFHHLNFATLPQHNPAHLDRTFLQTFSMLDFQITHLPFSTKAS